MLGFHVCSRQTCKLSNSYSAEHYEVRDEVFLVSMCARDRHVNYPTATVQNIMR